MRRILALLLVGCAAPVKPTPPEKMQTIPPQPRASCNLLLNPSFEEDWHHKGFGQQRRFMLLQASDIGVGEQDGLPDHWSGQTTAVKPHSGRRALQGSASQRLRWLGENGWQVGGAHYGGFLPLQSSLASQIRKRPITIGAWCRSEGATAPPRLEVELLYQDRPGAEAAPLNNPTQQRQAVDFEAGSHDWQYRELTVTPTGPLHFLSVNLQANGGAVWFDDCLVKEDPAPDEVNLVPNGGFEVTPGGWSPPQLWTWFRNEYYTFTGWSHEDKKTWRGQARLDPLIHWQGRAAMRFQVHPGDNFAVAGPTIQLHQKQPHPLELRALVKADQLRTLELMAQDENGQWLPQGDFLGDDMENNPGLYNMGTTGSGTYDWICLRKYLAPRRPLRSLKLFLCARGFDGERVPKNTIGTVWWDDVQLYQHGGQPPAPPATAPGSLARGLEKRLRVDWGERLIGENRVTIPDENYQLVYRGRAGQPCQLQLKIGEFSSDYTFAIPREPVECEVDRYFAYPDEKIQVFVRVNLSSHPKAELLVNGKVTPLSPPAGLPDYVDATRVAVASLSPSVVHPWSEPARDLQVVARLPDGTRSKPLQVGFMQKIPAPRFPAHISSTQTDSRGYLRINGQPYFPVYWVPNFERPSEGNYPPRFWGCPSFDLNDLGREKVLQKVAEARANPRFFAYELGDGEMQLQGPGWPLRLQAVKTAMGWVRQADPRHLINGPETWLVGHPGHAQAMRTFMPLYDVIGVETSFDDVPEPHQSPDHPCAVLAGLEAYYYQPVESLRWRGYRAVQAGCAGVGLCPSEMLKARPAHVNYLRGLNGEFRGLEAVFTAPEPTRPLRIEGPVLAFQRQLNGILYLFVIAHQTVPAQITCRGVTGPVKVRGEDRSLTAKGSFTDSLEGPHSVHVYEMAVAR